MGRGGARGTQMPTGGLYISFMELVLGIMACIFHLYACIFGLTSSLYWDLFLFVLRLSVYAC